MTVQARPPRHASADSPIQGHRVPYPSRRSATRTGQRPPAPVVPEQPWATRAACRSGYPEDLWWPDGTDGGTPRRPDTRVLVAREVCRGCPVRAECLDDAQARREATDPAHGGGIWGGLTGPERRRLGFAWRLGKPLPEIPRLRPADLGLVLASRWAAWLPATQPTTVAHRSLATQVEQWAARQRAS